MAQFFKGSDVNSELYPLPQRKRRFAREEELQPQQPGIEDAALEETANHLERTIEAAKQLGPAIDMLNAAVKSGAQEEGYREGVAKAQAETQHIMMEAMAALTAAQGERERIAQLSREALADLAMTIARRVIGQHLAADPDLVARIVADTISELEPSYSVHVHVNPADLDVLERHRDELNRLVSEGTVHLVADERVDQGGCILISPAGDVDARISTKLSVLETAFAAQRRHVDGGA